jgi:hypothetical protein
MALLLSVPNTTFASEKNSIIVTNNIEEVPAAVTTMLNRLEEIKTMDKSSLQSSDRKALRKEVRAINSSLASSGGGSGLYLSTGAIIIIILLLILLV